MLLCTAEKGLGSSRFLTGFMADGVVWGWTKTEGRTAEVIEFTSSSLTLEGKHFSTEGCMFKVSWLCR